LATESDMLAPSADIERFQTAGTSHLGHNGKKEIDNWVGIRDKESDMCWQ
jgi:hypothetical protein